MEDDDFKMAIILQQQFNQEIELENPKNGLIYEDKKKKKGLSNNNNNNFDNQKCLVDPSWELVDPTPDIHVLFISFNERFFWNKLGTVTVSWSKRMTVCAGVCAYSGRGNCKITLSEPLLKLRPRKDLVETLLHEMIHALLFLTNKDRHSRDGHGPEFHKHMFRINNEAGTNISVYHDFHDEVKLYQQHWWRCNGPCQKWKPYYGFVKRSMNRAPGPNDFWFNEHQHKCGGTFIKVKEPEKPAKKKSSTENKKSTTSEKENKAKNKNFGNITKFISVTSPPNANSTANINTLNTITNKGGNFGTKNKNGTVVLNPKTKTRTKSESSTNDLANLDSNLSRSNSKSTKSNGNIFTIKDIDSMPKSEPKQPKNLQNQSKTEETQMDYSIVRKKWLEKFGSTSESSKNENKNGPNSSKKASDSKNSTQSQQKSISNLLETFTDSSKNSKRKSKSSSDLISSPNKKIKSQNGSIEKFLTHAEVECPICQRKIEKSKINEHIDVCLENGSSSNDQSCGNQKKLIGDDSFEELKPNDIKIRCPVCKKSVYDSEMDEHLDRCLNGDKGVKIMKEPSESFGSVKKVEKPEESESLVQCEICDNFVNSVTLDSHMEQCLHKLYDEIESKYNLSSTRSEMTDCLVCNKKINRSELNEHLDTCSGQAFKGNAHEELDYKDENDDVFIENKSNNENSEKKYNCPICLKLIEESVMNKHIDICLTENNLDLDD